MTAFARSSQSADWGEASIEIRSVNNRYLDVYFRLPEEIRAAEPLLREQISKRIGRGKLDCTLKLELRGTVEGFDLDMALATRLLTAAGQLQALNESTATAAKPQLGPVNPLELLRWPGIVLHAQPDKDALLPRVSSLLDCALNELVATREREGARILEFMQIRCDKIDALADEAEKRLPEVITLQRQRLQDRLAEVLDKLDNDRLEQELLLIANRADVAEELDRLRTHVDEVRRTMSQDKPVGRRLDFLMQELNREANTLGSKSVDGELTRIGVDLKVLIEQMREQVQNVE